MDKNKKQVDPAVKEFFAEIGRRNGKALFEKRGSAYFSKIAKLRKKHGRERFPENSAQG